jgi:hypothetical protein
VLIAKNKDGRPNDGTQTGRGRGAGGGGGARGARGGGGDSAQAQRRGGGGGAGRRGGGGGGGSCGTSYNCFTWVIDAHPEDMQMEDYTSPAGEVVMRTIADYRQLNDALFHAGLNSGSSYEWQDPHNRLHFYVIDVHRDARDVLSYTVGVRSLDGSGPQRRGVAVDDSPAARVAGSNADCTFDVRNTGTSAATDAAAHPQDASAFLGQDIYRLAVATEARGLRPQLLNALVAVPFGESRPVTVHVGRDGGQAGSGTVTLTAVSEGDPTQRATGSCTVAS